MSPAQAETETIFPKLPNESQKDWGFRLMKTIAEEASANWSPESFEKRRLRRPEEERVRRFEEGRIFTIFRNLLPELRREIWKFLLPGPRIIPFFPASEAPLYPELDMNGKNSKLPPKDANIVRETLLYLYPEIALRTQKGN